jgi:hypothetical protein
MSRCANPVSISSLLCSAVSRAADKTPSYWAKPVLISAADFPTAEGAARSACGKVTNFFRHPLASFLQMASYGGQTVVVDSVLATTCAAAQ